MIRFFEKFKIPTILGLGIIFIGIVVGVFLVLREQNFISQASPDIRPKNITFTNIEDSTVVISWQTENPAISFISFGQNSFVEQTIKDDQDQKAPTPHNIHYVTLKNLLPKSEYQFKIVTGKISSDILKFQTASPVSTQNNFGPVIGSVLDGEKVLGEGIAYLSISNAVIQSSLVKNLGSFLIPLVKIRKSDLSDIFPLDENTIAKLTIVSKNGQSSALFKLKPDGVNLPPLRIGENLDLTNQQIIPQIASSSAEELKTFDLNGDGEINAADNAIILRNFGKNPKEKKADLNSDGVVDQKDLDLMAGKINK